MTATAGDGAPNLRELFSTAFTDNEPSLPDLDDVLGEIEVLGARLKRRQRIRTGVATAVLCVSAFAMVSGISYIVHSNTTTSVTTIPGNGGGAPSDETTARNTAP